MTPLERLGPAELRSLVEVYREALGHHQEAINRLNVYPVPDGDTGTNMALTLESVVKELGEGGDMATVCGAVSRGSLMGARGNSGVILSQVLRGLCSTWAGAAEVDGALFARALAAATDGAYAAVMRPVEGTILTVVRESAEAAGAKAEAGGTLVDVLEAARGAGQDALERTPDLLAVLAEAGVVDAGGAGFLLFLDAALSVVDARRVPEPDVVASPAALVGHRDHEGGATPSSGPRYEVMHLLEAPDESIPALEEAWAAIGDSIVVVGGEGTWNCHVHTDDIGAAVEAALECGRPRGIRVADLHEQVEEERWVREAGPARGAGTARATSTTAVVAVAAGAGLGRILRSLGASAVVTGGQSMNPSTAQLLDAVEATHAPEVVILPNNANVVEVARQVDGLTARVLRVVPTRSVPEGLAALLALDPELASDVNAAAMAEAAGVVVGGEVTQAVRDSTSAAGPIVAGDWLGIGPDGIAVVAADAVDATTGLLGALVGDDHELVTLIEGQGALAEDRDRITAWVGAHRSGVEVEVHRGDQPLYRYLLGIE